MDQIPAAMDRHLDVIQCHKDGGIILGASGLTGRYWLGSLWYYENPSFAADVEKCTAGVQLESGVTDVVWIGNTRVLLALDTGGVELWELEDNFKTFTHVQTAVEHDNITSSVSQLVECQKAVSGSYDRSIKVWDLASMISVHTFRVHTDTVHSIQCHPSESDIFSSCSQDNNVILWDLRNPKPALIVDTAPLMSYPTCLTWQQKSQFVLAVGSENGQTVVKDIRNTVNSPVSYSSHSRSVHRLEFCPTRCNMLASVSDDCSVVITNIDTNKPEQMYKDSAHKDFVHGLSWSTSGETLYTCSWDSHVRSHTVNNKMNESKSVTEQNVMEINGDINKHKPELSNSIKLEESENRKNALLNSDHVESAQVTA